MSLKKKFLEIHQLALFATFEPSKTNETYLDLINFLKDKDDSLTQIEYYNLLELQFYLALISCRDEVAKVTLDRIIDKFGDEDSERIAVLKIKYLSATSSEEDAALNYIESRKGKNEIHILKSTIALNKNKNNSKDDYVVLLKGLLEVTPLDVEVISELGEYYYQLGHFDKAIFTLQDILLVQPFNHLTFARLGEIYNAIYKRDPKAKDATHQLIQSQKHFSRSIELCSNFVRGWSGLYISSKELKTHKVDKNKLANYDKLYKLSRDKLKEIIDLKTATNKDLEYASKILQSF
ncbi:hypothetical protein WICMUC_005600 [Wickerhamomyces mucosus]|uniref:ER membrane protein complex subunit 2 n=1 Tax=Wickerhamomyces mucosus TaxID=1378264 RepID=A0A9P8T5B3_9ASCO|nr:hypothetical protein WICMUC_005600 [Wickerhamomyces mucosus]